MKKCPYCAEDIQDEAIKCRYCQSWLVDEVPAGAGAPPKGVEVHEPPAADTSAATTSAAEPEPTAAEPEPAADAQPAASAPVVTTPAATAPVASAPAPAPTPEVKIEWTHTGERYLLGYTPDAFGIWDRMNATAPLERFPRTDDGWRQAWARYATMERNWMDLRTGQRAP